MDTADGSDLQKIQARRAKHKARGINGNGFGESLSEKAQTAVMNWPSAKTSRGGWERDRNGNVYQTLEGAAETWRGPSDISKRGGSQTPEKRQAGGHSVNLEDQAEHWSGPQARDHFPAHTEEYIAAKKAEGHGMRNLNDEAAKWEAPSVAVTDGSRLTRGGDRSNELLLTGQAVEASKQWAAPAAQNHKGSSEGSIIRADGKSREDILSYQAEQFFRPPSSLQPSSPDRPIAGGSMCSTDSPNSNQPSAKRKLNPIFVEALMRWPTGLSGFARPEMASILWQQRMLSFLSTLCCAREPEQGALL